MAQPDTATTLSQVPMQTLADSIEFAKIAAKAAESEKRIAEIRAGAEQAVGEVARDTAGALVAALGGTADDAAIAAAVAVRLKG